MRRVLRSIPAVPPVVGFFLWLVVGAVNAQGLPNFVTLVEEYGDAVVSVTAESVGEAGDGFLGQLPIPEDSPLFEYFRRFFEQAPPNGEIPQQTAMGSGFIISEDGYILTNSHVVQEGTDVRVTLNDRREFPAELIGLDQRSDVAVLKIDATDLPVIRIGDSEQLEVGQWVLAIGAPFGLEHTATQGIISALGRNLPGDVYVPFIQTDAAVNPGNSGGPLFNLDGEVIGVNSMIYTGSGGYQGVSFAIPINVAMDVVKQLRTKGRVSRGWLGVYIQRVTPGLAESFGLEQPRGALVGEIIEGGPADKAGLRVGDIILSFNNQPVETAGELPPNVGQTEPGKRVPITIFREGRERRMQITIEELPGPEEQPGRDAEPPAPPDKTGRLNITVSNAPPQAGPGVLVREVGPGPAARAGIQPGDIIARVGDTEVANTAAFNKAISAVPAGRSVPLLVRRDGQPLFLAVRMPEE